MKPIRFSQLKLRTDPEIGNPEISDIKIPVFMGAGDTAKNFNINATDLTIGSDAVDQTFDPTSEKAQSGAALNFLEPSTDYFSVTFSKDADKDVKFTIATIEHDDGSSIFYTHDIGYKVGDQQNISIPLENLDLLSEYGIIEEEGTSIITDKDANGYIEGKIKAALQDGRILSEVELQGSGVQPEIVLTEGNIAHSVMNYTTAANAYLDLSNIKVARYATAEIWIDIPSTLPDSATTNKQPSFTWPVSDIGTTSWLEISEPASLERGKRYVIVIRNDGSSVGAHYCLNLAYELPLIETV